MTRSLSLLLATISLSTLAACGSAKVNTQSELQSVEQLVFETRRLSDDEITARGYDVAASQPATTAGPITDREAHGEGLRLNEGIINALAAAVTALFSDETSIKTTPIAHAIPIGSSVFQLTGGKRQHAVYEKKVTSLLGATILKLAYKITFDTGLKFNNHGQYIANVTFTPLEYQIDPLWDVEVTGTSLEARNIGSSSAPVGHVGFSITTALSGLGKRAVTDSFEVYGNSSALEASIRDFE